jgi:NADH-quinone oxidoreductase subunit D
MRQSIRIVRQAIEKMPDGAINVSDPRISLPKKDNVLKNMEDLINNFVLVTQGPDIPKGEAYFEAENPKGALGFYVVSNGGGVPYRVKVRAPSFVSLSAMQEILPGHHMSDMAVILGSFDFVLGECDR